MHVHQTPPLDHRAPSRELARSSAAARRFAVLEALRPAVRPQAQARLTGSLRAAGRRLAVAERSAA